MNKNSFLERSQGDPNRIPSDSSGLEEDVQQELRPGDPDQTRFQPGRRGKQVSENGYSTQSMFGLSIKSVRVCALAADAIGHITL